MLCVIILFYDILSYVASALSYNEIEYFVYVNLLIVSLLLFYVILFMLIYSSTLILNSVFYNDVFIEVIMTFVSFLYILLIISPGLLLFLDYDFIFFVVNFNVYILGYQWAWNYNIMFNSAVDLSSSSFANLSYSFDQLILSSLSFSSSISSLFAVSSLPMLLTHYLSGLLCEFTFSSSISSAFLSPSLLPSFHSLLLPFSSLASFTPISISSPASIFSNFYMCLFSAYLVLPLYATISFYVLSFDVIHSFGYHSFGFKSDAILGRVNSVAALSLFVPGFFSSYCYELCGSSHTSMLSSIISL